MDRKQIDHLFNTCEHFLIGRGPQASTPAVVFSRLAEETPGDLRPDMYGMGELIESFEREVADLLGKPAAVFMPSGTMAQQIALRMRADRCGCKTVAFHPRCHLEVAEQMGYRILHGLEGIAVGSPHALMTLDDLKSVKQPLGSLLIELPQREIGGLLPSWEDLVAMTDWTRAQGIHLHMDGARLWECKPFYGREYAEIAGLFDTVYVSMYKGLGAIAGAVLAGPEEEMAEARIWLRRHGGNLISMYPFVLSARMGMRDHLPRMEEYHRKAQEVAGKLLTFSGVRIKPNPPQTNMMHVFIPGKKDDLDAAMLQVAETRKTVLFRGFVDSGVPGITRTEITVLDGALNMPESELDAALQDFFQAIG